MVASMSRGKLSVSDVCGDCGAIEPAWASVNRGILLCNDCCSIHRSLGRHISQVKSLRKDVWPPSLLQMVHTLNNNGVNSIWEHSLLDPNNSKLGRRKPQPKDPVHPVKEEFIRAKHQMFSFVFRPGKDDTHILASDLSKQLHSSVRTANLETSMRLLSQGADPNYFHEEKGTTPLHVAAKAGQFSQAELLIVYGADPGAVDVEGKTPIDFARFAGHEDLADRLVECMYELTDQLASYLGFGKPDHQNGQHFIVPEISDGYDRTEAARAAKKQLQQLPNHLFEELAVDVYDEVERLETEKIWLSLQQGRSPVLFLPVNPEFSATRNQGRQKLARFSRHELRLLITDILFDAKRRHYPTTSSLILFQDNCSKISNSPVQALKNSLVLNRKSEISDDEPLYDSVASDEDYATTEYFAALGQQMFGKYEKPEKTSELVDTQGYPNMSINFEETLKQKLEKSGAKVDQMKAEIQALQLTVCTLVRENQELKRTIQTAGLALPLSNGHETDRDTEPVLDVKSSPRTSCHPRPVSMYEPREALLHKWDKHKEGISEFDNQRPVHSLYTNRDSCLPLAEEVMQRTDQVTKRIQELVASMQITEQRDAFVPCAERIRVAVAELIAIFPLNPVDETVRSALRLLHSNTSQLLMECAGLQRCAGQTDQRNHYLQQVRSCAYDIAKATKQLITKFSS